MDSIMKKKYFLWEWRTIICLMIGYALFYFVRKNLSMAIPAMEAQLGLSKVQLGIFMTLNGVIYGASRFVNGYLVDRFSRRKIMSLGLLLSAAVNFIIAFSPKMNGFLNLLDGEGKATMGLVYLIGSLWLVNGYLQGMGVPPCVSLLSHWIRPKELPTKQSIWNTSHSIGAGLVVLLCGFLLKTYGYSAWNLCFIVPAAIALVGVPVIFFGIKDDPTEVGLPPVEKMDEESAEKKAERPISNALQHKIMQKMVFQNPIIWIIALANFCMNVIRGTILDWGGAFLVQDKGLEISVAGSVVGACELFGGILGMLAAGWVTDRFFQHKAHRTCLVCMILTTVCFFLFWGSTQLWATIVFLVLSAFFIYGPQALYGTCASMQCTKYAAGTGNGIIGILGYLSTFVSGIWFGHIAGSALGWNRVYVLTIAFGVVGSIIIALLWRIPADGYEKVNRIIAENPDL
ncbi:MAG: MFS transporter [Bacteroidales bacterium]|nr:MFS transporter [Bacteroidales bacterium]